VPHAPPAQRHGFPALKKKISGTGTDTEAEYDDAAAAAAEGGGGSSSPCRSLWRWRQRALRPQQRAHDDDKAVLRLQDYEQN